jgi:hypothetical protein
MRQTELTQGTSGLCLTLFLEVLDPKICQDFIRRASKAERSLLVDFTARKFIAVADVGQPFRAVSETPIRPIVPFFPATENVPSYVASAQCSARHTYMHIWLTSTRRLGPGLDPQ